MRTGTQIDEANTHNCLDWDTFKGRLLIYGRNLDAVATEFFNSAPPELMMIIYKEIENKNIFKTNSGNNPSSKSTFSKPNDTKEKSKDQEGKKEKK
jgi:hypothetical protein